MSQINQGSIKSLPDDPVVPVPVRAIWLVRDMLNKNIFSTKYTYKHIIYLLLGLYVVHKIVRFVRRRNKMQSNIDLAIKQIMKRNGRTFTFKLDGINVGEIIGKDITGLQEGLLGGKYTSVMLVHVFGDRCQRIGRSLCLTAEENFE